MEGKMLQGKVALVTGAGRGIGRAIALALAGEGARVALAARTESDLRAVKDEIASAGGEAAVFPADVSDESQVNAVVAGAVERFGRLDIVVNNAGIALAGPLENTKTEEWDRTMAVNARGPFLVCRSVIPHLRRQGGGFIVNIASVVGVKTYENQSAYSASKHALMGMTGVLAKEVQKDGIRVHAVCPGGVDTPMVNRTRPDLDRSILIKPEEIADVVLFLVTRRGNAVIDEVHVRRDASMPFR